jgi:hypothetical protein|tara:strand:- start:6 stop:182 length:177 start_codon:yes stop_codon:yes gene_type:complete
MADKIYKTAKEASDALKKMGGYAKTGGMVMDLGKGKGYKIVKIREGIGGTITFDTYER